MGDAKGGPVRLSFNPQLRVEFQGATVTSDAGLLLPRELDERLDLNALIKRHLTSQGPAQNGTVHPVHRRETIHAITMSPRGSLWTRSGHTISMTMAFQ